MERVEFGPEERVFGFERKGQLEVLKSDSPPFLFDRLSGFPEEFAAFRRAALASLYGFSFM